MPSLSSDNLPDPGMIRYGTYTFPSTTLTEDIDIRTELDSAKRTVIYNTIAITLRCHLTGRDIDLATRALTQVLTKPAQPFVYSGRGYAFTINVGSARDVLWGPIPQGVKLTRLTGGNAAVLTWSVRCAVADGALRSRFAPMEFNFTVDYDIDGSGLTTRVMTGHLRIPMTRTTPNDRRLPDNIDSYREDINPPVAEGFRRTTPGSFTLNEAKDRLDFRFVDEQFQGQNVPPVGCIDATGTHQFSNPPGKLTQWNHTVACSYEIARNGTATIANARNAFFALVADRVKTACDEVDRLQPQLVSGSPRKTSAVPVSFSAREDIYGKPRVDFSLSFRISGPDLPTMVAACGLGRPVPGSNWRQWWGSVSNILGPRGQAGLAFSIDDDRIVDLFQPAPLVTNLSYRASPAPAAPGAIPRGIFPEPTPESSWLDWRMRVYQEVDNGVVEVRTLPTEPRDAGGDLFGDAARIALGAVEGLWKAGQEVSPFYFPPPRKPDQQRRGGNAQPQQPQRRTRQAAFIYLIGSALRVKYPIPAPALTKWGDATLTAANRPDMGEGFWTEVVGNTLWPVYGAAWCLRYACAYPASDTPPVQPNPLLGGGGQAPLNPNLGDMIPPGAARVPYGLPTPPG